MLVEKILNGNYITTIYNDEKVACEAANEICKYLKTHTLTKTEAKNLAEWMYNVASIVRFRIWEFLRSDLKNAFTIHLFICEIILRDPAKIT